MQYTKDNKTYTDFEINGIDFKDSPDFVDAYICGATVIDNNETRQATDFELNELNENVDLVHELVYNKLY